VFGCQFRLIFATRLSDRPACSGIRCWQPRNSANRSRVGS